MNTETYRFGKSLTSRPLFSRYRRAARPYPFLALIGLFVAGCVHVKMDPIEVNANVNVNVKVDKALDDFFGDLDRKSATIGSAAKS